VVDSSKIHFVLNPAGDLKSTQTTFQPWLETMRTKAGWSGTVGKAPREEELKVALSSNDLFL
jgi:separase